MGGHLVIPQNDILYTNEPPISSHLVMKVTKNVCVFCVLQGWLLIAGSTVHGISLTKTIHFVL